MTDRIVQPSVAKRITFATFARKAGLRRHSNVSYFVPEDFEIPAALMVGAQVDGKPYEPSKPKPTPTRRRRKIEEPAPEPEVAEPPQTSTEEEMSDGELPETR